MRVYHIVKDELQFAVGDIIQPKTYYLDNMNPKKRQMKGWVQGIVVKRLVSIVLPTSQQQKSQNDIITREISHNHSNYVAPSVRNMNSNDTKRCAVREHT